MKKTFDDMTRLQILESFGYMVLERTPHFVAFIKDDPEAFMVVCGSQDAAEQEAYEFLRGEADPKEYHFPEIK